MASPEIQSLKFSGAVLAGGESQRMGRDKALLQIDGETLLARQVRLLKAAGASEVIISQHPKRPRPISQLPTDVRLVWDTGSFEDCGPIAGISAVLQGAEFPLIAVVAVDLPFVTAAWWNRLLKITTQSS